MHAGFEVLILFAIAIIFNAISAAVKKSRENPGGGDWDEIEFDEPAPSSSSGSSGEGSVVEIPGFPGLKLRLDTPKPKPRPKAPPPIPQKAPPPIPVMSVATQDRMRVTRRGSGGNRHWNQGTLRKALVAREILNRPRCYDV